MRPIPQRTRFFVGGEGESEFSYALFLQRLADQAGLRIFIDRAIGGGGDPLATVEEVVVDLRRKLRKGAYRNRFVLLDEDKIGHYPDRDRQMRALASQWRLDLIFQRFDHEAVLLRHHQGRQTRRPPAGQSDGQLKRAWPDYRKPMAADDLIGRFSIHDVRRAATVEPGLARLLRSIGLL